MDEEEKLKKAFLEDIGFGGWPHDIPQWAYELAARGSPMTSSGKFARVVLEAWIHGDEKHNREALINALDAAHESLVSQAVQAERDKFAEDLKTVLKTLHVAWCREHEAGEDAAIQRIVDGCRDAMIKSIEAIRARGGR